MDWASAEAGGVVLSDLYHAELNREFDRVMANDAVAKWFYDLATKTYGLDHFHGMMAAVVALSNANKRLMNELEKKAREQVSLF